MIWSGMLSIQDFSFFSLPNREARNPRIKNHWAARKATAAMKATAVRKNLRTIIKRGIYRNNNRGGLKD